MVDFGSILAPKWSPNGTQNGKKTVPKINQKMIGFLIDFWSSQEATTLIGPSARGATSGGGRPQKLLAKANSD